MVIQDIFINAELALAAYATIDDNLDLNDQLDALVNAGFSTSQAANFSSRYSVVTQFTDNEDENFPDTGFSVTVFKDASGNLTVAFRGTEVGDFVNDILTTDINYIAAKGAGYDQITAMYNWWLRVSSPIGSIVPQFEYDGSLDLDQIAPVPATGELVGELSEDPDKKVDVTGHSLGAHLSIAFNALFGDVVNEVVGFNTPGFTDTQANRDFFAELGGEVPTAANSENVININADQAGIGEQPFDAIAGLHFEDNPTGEIIRMPIEDQAGLDSDEPDPAGALNHSQMVLTDSLAVYG